MKITKKQLQEMVRREIKRTIKEQLESESKKIVQYRELWDEEDLEIGETDRKKMVQIIEPEPDDEDETIDEWTADFLQQIGAEPSSTQFHSGIWYSATDEEGDMMVVNTFHLKGFTPEEEKEVYKQVKRGY